MNQIELTAAVAELAAVRAHKNAFAAREKELAALITPELTANVQFALDGVTAKMAVSGKVENVLDMDKVLAYFKGEIPAELFTAVDKTSKRLLTGYADKVKGLREKTKAERCVVRVTDAHKPAETPAEAANGAAA